MVDGPYCSGCCQESRGEALVTFDGSASSGLMLIGESPWTDEIRARRPFAGAAGYMLDRLLRRVSLDRSVVCVTNSAWCKSRWLGWYDNPKRWPESAEAMAHCAPYLDGLIERMRPRVLVPMGNVALRRICGVSGIDEMTSYVFPTSYGIPAVPCYHPSFILRGKQKMSASVLFALNRAKEIAARGYSPSPPTLLLDPDPVTLARYISEHTGSLWDGSIFIDLETPESGKLDEEEVEEMGASWIILRASFSLADNTGVSFPWTEPFIGIFRDLLSRSTETWEWATNHFDTRRLEAAGLALPARRISGLWAWHWLQSDLPKGLGKVAPYFGSTTAWKHMNTSEPAYYSAMDSSEGRRAAFGSRDLLKSLGRWDSFERHCIQSDPILVRMGRTGVLIDIAERTRFMDIIQGEYDAAYAELQLVVPESVKPVKYWKRPPKDMTRVIDLSPPPPLCSAATVGGSVTNEVGSPLPTSMFLEASGVALGEKLSAVLPAEAVPKWLHAAGVRYMRREEFNPNSSDQVAVLAKALKVKLPKPRDAEDDEDAVTTERKYLLAPARKHRAFRLVLDCRERSKLLSTYAWPLNAAGRVTTVFGWHPSTLRKSSRSVNLQNIPKRSSLAKAFRRMIVAAPGYVLVEADWSAIEAVLVGWFARSERYMTLAKAGVHGWLTSALHGEIIDWRHPELFALAKEAKARWPDDYEKCKRVVHMCLTGDHEVLTERGWVRLDTYNGYESIAQWHEGVVRFVEPQALIQQDFSGNLIHFKGQALDQLVTPNHGMPVSVDHSWKTRKVSAERLRATRDYLPLTGSYPDGDLNPSATELLLAVVTQADGSLHGQTVHVKLRRKRKIYRLLAALEGLPHRIKLRRRDTLIQFPSYLLGIAADLVNARKQFTWACLRLAPNARQLFLDELPYWDGSRSVTQNHSRTQYNTAVERNAIIVQTLAHLDARQGLLRFITQNGKRYWLVSFNRRKFAYIGPIKREAVAHTGPVYCLTVPSGYFLVRHNDRISVTGNSNYLGSPIRMAEEYPDDFPTVAVARKLQGFYFETDPGLDVRRWQRETVARADHDGYLDNPYGYRHWFYEVTCHDKRSGTRKPGDDAKRAVAFLPQSTASAIQSECLLRLVEIEEWLRLIIHDSFLTEPTLELRDTVCQILLTEMTRPIPELGCLVVGTELSWGLNWAPHSLKSNPDGMRPWTPT